MYYIIIMHPAFTHFLSIPFDPGIIICKFLYLQLVTYMIYLKYDAIMLTFYKLVKARGSVIK